MAKNKVFGIILVLLFSVTVLIGCPKNELENDPLRSSVFNLETEMKIQFINDLSDYLGFDVGNIKFNDYPNSTLYYFGNYNDCVIIAFEGDAAVITNISVENIVFTFYYSSTMLAWKNGQFYTIQEAYDSKFLTKENLKSIYEQYVKYYVNRNN